jgi:predicted transcriptional regulator
MLNRRAIGCIRENRLMAKLLVNKNLLESSVKDVMEECVPVLDAKTDISKVKEVLKDNQAVLVSDFGRITDIITRYDIINFDNQ